MGRLELTCPAGPSDTGAFTLDWTGPARATYRLTEDGGLLYEGPALATTVSGRPQGSYAYRVEVVGARSSDSCTVQVQPPSVSTAMVLFFIGLGVFLASLIVIVRGHRSHGRPEP